LTLQRNPEGYISHITPTAGQYHDIALACSHIALACGQGYIMILPWLVVRLIALTHKGLCIDLHGSLYKTLWVLIVGFRYFAKINVIDYIVQNYQAHKLCFYDVVDEHV